MIFGHLRLSATFTVFQVYSGHLHHNPVQVEPITGNKIDKVTQFLTDQVFN